MVRLTQPEADQDLSRWSGDAGRVTARPGTVVPVGILARVAGEPTGTLTFLFTDIEGSTRRWQQDPEAMREALARHDAVLSDCIGRGGGRVFKHTGDGMSAAFRSAGAAVEAAVDVQRTLSGHDWGSVGGLRVRMGMHTGEAAEQNGDYFGPSLNRAARVMAAAHGGQILLSSATAGLLDQERAGRIGLRDLGEHVLRDIERPERLFQVTAEGLQEDFPPVRAGGMPSHNLPARRSSFVGRAADLDELVDLLAKVPLVTLVGIGGTGKTRLALEIGHRLIDRFGSVVFADLSALADGQQVPGAIAAACGLTAAGPARGSLLETVIAVLSRRPSLLILDNCEHLIEDCAEIVEQLLGECPELTVLATSREALSVDGERIWPVGSLPSAEARELFVDRAQTAAPGVRLGPADEAAVEEICRRLDGIPLAIELAAARIGHLGPEELAARLHDRFRILTGGRSRRTQRQHTLRAAIDWSYELLSPAEADLFARLSVFSGSFTLQAAEAVCEDSAWGESVLDLLGSLVGKSLVVAERSELGSRYRLLETIRMYAADRLLEAGELDARRDAHRDYFVEFLGAFPLDERAAGEVPALTADIDNLRAAIDWSEVQGRPDLAVRLAAGMGTVWSMLELQEEGAARISGLLGQDGISDDVRAAGLAVLSCIHMSRADFREMARAGRRALALAPESPWASIAYTYSALYLVFNPTRYEEAHQLFEDARRVAGQHDLPLLADLASAVEAHLWLMEGDVSRPVELASGMSARGSFADVNAGMAAVVALILRGELEQGLEMADRLLRGGGGIWGLPVRACALAEMGREGEAEELLRGIVPHFLEQPFPLLVGDFLIATAALHLSDDPARSAELLESVVSERGPASFRSPAMFVLWQRYRQRAEQALSAPALEAARARGARVPPDEAIRAEAEWLRSRVLPEEAPMSGGASR